ncbi:MAG TPA: helix-turn-helix transcriptional regulator [Pseudonocardiaceae bacterium]|nr:helix-turn-helix transcriptional regulator [Pseudonocardiaceae bacterium]
MHPSTRMSPRYSLPPERSAEEYVSEDWAAVAQAISQRMTELGINQADLIERSQVSKATVGELYHNSAQRRRSARTLEALSMALGWHPQHLGAVLKSQRVPGIGEPVSRSDDDISGRLSAIEYRLAQIEARLGFIDELSDRLGEINANVEAVMRFVDSNQKGVRG